MLAKECEEARLMTMQGTLNFITLSATPTQNWICIHPVSIPTREDLLEEFHFLFEKQLINVFLEENSGHYEYYFLLTAGQGANILNE